MCKHCFECFNRRQPCSCCSPALHTLVDLTAHSLNTNLAVWLPTQHAPCCSGTTLAVCCAGNQPVSHCPAHNTAQPPATPLGGPKHPYEASVTLLRHSNAIGRSPRAIWSVMLWDLAALLLLWHLCSAGGLSVVLRVPCTRIGCSGCFRASISS